MKISDRVKALCKCEQHNAKVARTEVDCASLAPVEHQQMALTTEAYFDERQVEVHVVDEHSMFSLESSSLTPLVYQGRKFESNLDAMYTLVCLAEAAHEKRVDPSARGPWRAQAEKMMRGGGHDWTIAQVLRGISLDGSVRLYAAQRENVRKALIAVYLLRLAQPGNVYEFRSLPGSASIGRSLRSGRVSSPSLPQLLLKR